MSRFRRTVVLVQEGALYLLLLLLPFSKAAIEITFVLLLMGWIAQRLMPSLGHLRAIRTWAGIINVLADGSPVLGEVPGVPGFYVACASVGYTSGPVSARLVAETVMGRKPSLDISPFGIERFAQASGGR